MGSNRRPLLIALGCLALLTLCCVIVAAAGGIYYLRGRTQAESPGVAYILDTSPRMALDTERGNRLAVAQGVMAEIVRPANPSLTSGLRIFGSGTSDQSCRDTELVVPFRPANQSQIAAELESLQTGSSSESALAQAMIDAIQDLAATDGPQSLVVVTGGADSCNPQAGELIAQEADRAGIRLQTFVVGFDVTEEEATAIKGIVSETPGATYYDAPDEEALREVLTEIQQHVNNVGQETACNHPYFPLKTGARWDFSGDGISYSLQVASVSGDLESASADVVSSFSGGSVTYEWTCSDGGINFTQFGAISIDDFGGVGKFEISDQSGHSLLPASQLTPGTSWNSEYTMTYSIGIADLSSAFSSHTSEQHTVQARQSLSTAAGTFEVIPVASEGTMTFSGDFVGGSSNIETTIYYAQGVGIVRVESSSEGFSLQLDLSDYYIP